MTRFRGKKRHLVLLLNWCYEVVSSSAKNCRVSIFLPTYLRIKEHSFFSLDISRCTTYPELYLNKSQYCFRAHQQHMHMKLLFFGNNSSQTRWWTNSKEHGNLFLVKIFKNTWKNWVSHSYINIIVSSLKKLEIKHNKKGFYKHSTCSMWTKIISWIP